MAHLVLITLFLVGRVCSSREICLRQRVEKTTIYANLIQVDAAINPGTPLARLLTLMVSLWVFNVVLVRYCRFAGIICNSFPTMPLILQIRFFWPAS